MGKRRQRHPEPAGLTLVELLIVVAIIALLVAILLPAITKAKELTRRVICGSNMRQLSVGIFGYAADNRNQLFTHWQSEAADQHGLKIYEWKRWRYFSLT